MKIRRLVGIALVVVLFFISAYTVCADTIEPRADEVFSSAYAYLYDNKDVKVFCLTKTECASIRVTACWSEQNVDGNWVYGEAITLSSNSVANDFSFGIEENHAYAFGSGTYRVGFIAVADGHHILRYSNERTFQ